MNKNVNNPLFKCFNTRCHAPKTILLTLTILSVMLCYNNVASLGIFYLNYNGDQRNIYPIRFAFGSRSHSLRSFDFWHFGPKMKKNQRETMIFASNIYP